MKALMRVLKQTCKSHYTRNSPLWRCAAYVYSRLHGFHVRGGGRNRVLTSGVLMKGVSMRLLGGDNEISIGAGSRLTRLEIVVRGSHCKLRIGPFCVLSGSIVLFEDDNSEIDIAEHTEAWGAEIASIEGQTVHIGRRCLFSADVVIRNGDSHSVLDVASGKRINPSLPIRIGDHVWLGRHVTVLKGAVIGNDAVIGAAAVVTGEVPTGVIAAGVPAKVIKTGVDWCDARIPI